jgi:hypothetical protein
MSEHTPPVRALMSALDKLITMYTDRIIDAAYLKIGPLSLPLGFEAEVRNACKALAQAAALEGSASMAEAAVLPAMRERGGLRQLARLRLYAPAAAAVLQDTECPQACGGVLRLIPSAMTFSYEAKCDRCGYVDTVRLLNERQFFKSESVQPTAAMVDNTATVEPAAPVLESWPCRQCRTPLNATDEGRPCWRCGREDWK